MEVLYELQAKKHIYKALEDKLSPEEIINLAKTPYIPRSCINTLEREIVKTNNDNLIYRFSNEINNCTKEYLYKFISNDNHLLKIIYIVDFLHSKLNDFCYYTNLDIEICRKILKIKKLTTKYLQNIGIKYNSIPLLCALIRYKKDIKLEELIHYNNFIHDNSLNKELIDYFNRNKNMLKLFN